MRAHGAVPIPLEAQWRRTLAGFSIEPAARVFAQLMAAYGGRRRHYHTLAHIADCLQQFDLLRARARYPEEVELALWFHDAVYRILRSDNERRSADWARRFLHDHGVRDVRAQRVYQHILATRHGGGGAEQDSALVVDVDLSILGRSRVKYAAFEAAIRREYRCVPWPLYRRKRSQILQSFLARKRIYQSELFAERYEDAARANLRFAIQDLRDKRV